MWSAVAAIAGRATGIEAWGSGGCENPSGLRPGRSTCHAYEDGRQLPMFCTRTLEVAYQPSIRGRSAPGRVAESRAPYVTRGFETHVTSQGHQLEFARLQSRPCFDPFVPLADQ